MTHAHHESLPDYNPDAVLQDGCPECERRAEQGLAGLLELDSERVAKLWRMMLARDRGWEIADLNTESGQVEGPGSVCDAKLCTILYRIAVLLGRHGGGGWGALA